MANIKEILATLDDAHLMEFYNEISTITDDLGRALISKVGGPMSPLFIDEVPLKGFSKGESITRLYQLEQSGVFTSKMEKRGNGYVRKFYPTDIAKRIAEGLSVKQN